MTPLLKQSTTTILLTFYPPTPTPKPPPHQVEHKTTGQRLRPKLSTHALSLRADQTFGGDSAQSLLATETDPAQKAQASYP